MIVIARREKPLSAPAKLGLMATLALLNLLFYLFALLILPLLGLLIVVDAVLMIVLLRFGMSWLLVPALKRLWRMGRLIVRRLRLAEGANYHLPLAEADAPHLFATVRDCARRVGCPEPTSIVLEMTSGAWVRLEGVRSGHGKCTLGLGFELLAALSQAELEAVLLHEMAHARLVQRGLVRWTWRCVVRSVRLAEGLADLVRDERPPKGAQNQGWTSFGTGRACAFLVRAMARAGSRLYAAYSRQDEFEADRTAADLCGGQTFGETLVKTAMVGEKSSELHWLDRVMQSQREGSYTAWLRGKLLPADGAEAAKLRKEAIDAERRSPFNMHPTLEDRLAHVGAESMLSATAASSPVPPGALDNRQAFLANPRPVFDLPASGGAAQAMDFGGASLHPPAVTWMRDPDEMAERLFSLIERVQADEEREDSGALSRWERKNRRRQTLLTNWQLAAIVFIILSALVGGLAWFTLEMSPPILVFTLLFVGLGIGLYYVGAPAAPSRLPVPEYTLWEDSLQALWEASEKKLPGAPAPLKPVPGPPPTLRRQERHSYWKQRGFEAIQVCDYGSAVACGLQCLEANRFSGEGMLLAGVGYNGIGQEQAGDRLLTQAMSAFPNSLAVRWAAAWAYLTAGGWAPAEAYLLRVVEKLPAHPTLYGALALAQARRGKTRQAIENLRRACELAPDSMRLRLRLAQTLLVVGKARDAATELQALGRFPQASSDRDVRLAYIRLHLLLNHKEAADAEAGRVALAHPEPNTFFRIGIFYAMTDHFDDASAYFHHATAHRLYPMAWVHLGTLHAKAERKTEARVCFLGAVNLLHPIAPKAEDQLDALDAALGGLRGLREKAPTLFAWEVALNVRHLPAFRMAEFYLLILAPNRNGAIGYANELYLAMHPGGPPIETILLNADRAELEPPDEATEPGILDWRGRR